MTTIEVIDGAIKSLCYVVPPVAAAVIFLKNWQQNETERVRIKAEKDVAIAKENSAGAIAIAGLVSKDIEIIKNLDRMEQDFNNLEKDTKTQFQNIRQEIQQFTMEAIKLISGAKR